MEPVSYGDVLNEMETQKEDLHESDETLNAHNEESLENMTLEAYIEGKRYTVSNLPNRLVLRWQNKKRTR